MLTSNQFRLAAMGAAVLAASPMMPAAYASGVRTKTIGDPDQRAIGDPNQRFIGDSNIRLRKVIPPAIGDPNIRWRKGPLPPGPK